jgi:hypothetical protein
MEEITMCDNCIHKPVCSIYRATGGKKQCEHYKEERKGEWKKANIAGYLKCSRCEDAFVYEEWLKDGRWSYCPNCGADMRGTEDV